MPDTESKPKLIVLRTDGVLFEDEDAETFLAAAGHQLGDSVRFEHGYYRCDGVLELDDMGKLFVRGTVSKVDA